MPPTIIADAAPVAFSIDYNTILTTAVLAVTGWTLRSVDGSRGAHSEHTIAITETGPIVLTDRSHLG